MTNMRFNEKQLSVWEGVILCIRMNKDGKVEFRKARGEGFVRMAVMHPGFPILVQYHFADNYDYIGAVAQLQQHEVPKAVLEFMDEEFVSPKEDKNPSEHMHVWIIMPREGEEPKEDADQEFWVSVNEASVKDAKAKAAATTQQ